MGSGRIGCSDSQQLPARRSLLNGIRWYQTALGRRGKDFGSFGLLDDHAMSHQPLVINTPPNADSLDMLEQVHPIRVHPLNQAYAPFLRAALDLFLAQFRCRCIRHQFVVHQLDQVITPGEDAPIASTMLGHTSLQVGGATGIKKAVLFVGHDIDTKLAARHNDQGRLSEEIRLLYIFWRENMYYEYSSFTQIKYMRSFYANS